MFREHNLLTFHTVETGQWSKYTDFSRILKDTISSGTFDIIKLKHRNY